ncbi:hypothetical protein QVD17_39949 [Tagetes erecta]|uniref:Uncharacterized protein n=1 Tax=Tagetes erecta TaxID=13708 RepID=A0AAD8JRH3_TARER|nr:hypothetical protein QVD17_39949 [Tagetes erecta]
MYSPERLAYVKRLKLVEYKREAEKKEKRKKRTTEKEDKKRKKYERSSNLRSQDEPSDVDEPLVRKSKKARARSPSPTQPESGQGERRKGKQHVTEEVELESEIRHKNKKRFGKEKGRNEDVIRSFGPVVADELSMLKTKMMWLLNRDDDREKKVADLRRLVLKQQKVIKTLSSKVIELQQEIPIMLLDKELDHDNAAGQGTSIVPKDIVDLENMDQTVIGAEETEKEKKDKEEEDNGDDSEKKDGDVDNRGAGSGLGNKDDISDAEFGSDDDNPTSNSVIKVLLNLKNNLMISAKSKSMIKSKSTR